MTTLPFKIVTDKEEAKRIRLLATTQGHPPSEVSLLLSRGEVLQYIDETEFKKARNRAQGANLTYLKKQGLVARTRWVKDEGVGYIWAVEKKKKP